MTGVQPDIETEENPHIQKVMREVYWSALYVVAMVILLALFYVCVMVVMAL